MCQRQDMDTNGTFEEVMKLVGYGKFQKRFNYLFNLTLVGLLTAPYFNIVIALTIQDHWCHVPRNEGSNYTDEEWKNMTIPWKSGKDGGGFNQCTMYNLTSSLSTEATKKSEIECQNGWEYDATWFDSTIPSEANWVCDKELYVTYALMASSVGEVAGILFFGQFGDRIGRRPSFLTSTTLLMIGRLACCFTTKIFPLFLVTIFAGSFASFSIFQSPMVIAMEITREEDRAMVALLQAMGWNLAFCTMPLLYWLLGKWFPFMLITSAIPIIVLCCQSLMIESPRWLATKEKTELCIKELKKIADYNQTEFSPRIIHKLSEMKRKSPQTNSSEENIFSSLILIKRTIFVVLTWITSTFFYNIYFLNTSYIGGNPFMNYFWLALAEMPGNFLARYLCDNLGRQLTRFCTFLLATLGSIGMIFIIADPKYEIHVAVLSAFVKFNTSMIYYVLQLHTLELYPTPLRQTGLSISTIISGILGICSPYIIYLGRSLDPRIPYIICTCLGVMGLFAILPVPETLHQNLPETIKEAEVLGKDKSFWKIPRKPKIRNTFEIRANTSNDENGYLSI